MEKHYTPLNLDRFKKNKTEKKGSKLDTMLLIMGTLTAAVLSVLLFMLVQKKVNKPVQNVPVVSVATPTRIPSPTPTKIVMPTTKYPAASGSAVPRISPTVSNLSPSISP